MSLTHLWFDSLSAHLHPYFTPKVIVFKGNLRWECKGSYLYIYFVHFRSSLPHPILKSFVNSLSSSEPESLFQIIWGAKFKSKDVSNILGEKEEANFIDLASNQVS